MTAPADQAKLVELIGDIPIAMLTTYGGAGVRSVPMARQEVEPDAEMWFIAARDTKHVAVLLGGADRHRRGRRGRRQAEGAVEHLRRGVAPRRTRGPERRPDQGGRRGGRVLG